MDRKDCVAAILQECMAARGFLTELRGRHFDRERYNRLMRAMRTYRDLIRGEACMEREVACCLYYLDLDLRAALNSFPRTPEERAMMNEAQLVCSELIIEILTPEYMTRPAPPELLE